MVLIAAVSLIICAEFVPSCQLPQTVLMPHNLSLIGAQLRWQQPLHDVAF
jgi:hypothetical protein